MRTFQVLVTFDHGHDGRSADDLTPELAERILWGDAEPPGTLKVVKLVVVREVEDN